MNETVDVAIVGAGPYGLSLAAHLRGAGVRYRQFGLPLNLWRTAMPRGMYLKSQGFASSLSDPSGRYTLAQFCRETGRDYADCGMPVSLKTFLAYGAWFQQHQAPDVEEVLVTEITGSRGQYELALSDGGYARARSVVVAAGVEHFAHIPGMLSGLPPELCSHSSAHTDPGAFRGREVVVLGRGQSALEFAALLHESGASVQLVTRAPGISWNGLPLDPARPLLRRLREPEAGLGSGWGTWFYSRHPRWFRHLPAPTRVQLARTALGPAGAWWLRDRVEERFPTRLGHSLQWAEPAGDRVRLRLRGPGGEASTLTAEHVIAATGYRPDAGRLPFLSSQLRARLRTIDRTPQVEWDFQSSVPGLFFMGAAVAPTFGPVMRFVYGADYAARLVTSRLAAGARTSRTVEGAGR
ncbi:NADPH-dependent L-lysine 6-monooxygenase-like protein [Halopolyspora algeriensis]|uniref:L-lysine N6-monooxygenase MbtG n=1 Tax=Halopolyspora algeriensis TaxID=1500506 RepID=A0A368VRW2_9ACTN|nr:NAD(P)-binding domain-containing protein [Halopolyspora algeriensis]RCW44425.1 NADPH-dependent L-lysine 6-monooxygenase-like protein [Halopolyspora algeriensis]TQM55786.1 NADPH-dependent L-lysine 6-monooxygenase-like protein [Halopolyspora algeriensis]